MKNMPGRLNRFLSGEEVSLPAKIGRGLFAYFAGTVIADLVASGCHPAVWHLSL